MYFSQFYEEFLIHFSAAQKSRIDANFAWKKEIRSHWRSLGTRTGWKKVKIFQPGNGMSYNQRLPFRFWFSRWTDVHFCSEFCYNFFVFRKLSFFFLKFIVIIYYTGLLYLVKYSSIRQIVFVGSIFLFRFCVFSK